MKFGIQPERRMKMEEEIYYYMEAASGNTVRVPKSKLQEWIKAQDDIRKAEEEKEKE